jgi:hypothetical protein
MDEVTAIVDTIANYQSFIKTLSNEWESYLKLIDSIKEAAKNNPYLNDNALKRLEIFALAVRDETSINIFSILLAIKFLARVKDQKAIEKIILAAAEMQLSGILGFNEAAMALYKTTVLETGALKNTFPEIDALPKQELAEGGAATYVYRALKE